MLPNITGQLVMIVDCEGDQEGEHYGSMCVCCFVGRKGIIVDVHDPKNYPRLHDFPVDVFVQGEDTAIGLNESEFDLVDPLLLRSPRMEGKAVE